MKLDMHDMCFACGRENPIGLRLEFAFDGDEYVTRLAVRPEHQGWRGVIHGGLLATAMDETMARLLWERKINAITGRLEVRFHKPVSVGQRLAIRARITRDRPPVVETTAQARREDGALVAEARAVSMRV